MAKKPVIHLDNLTKNFGSEIAVDKLNLEVQEGEVFGFLGPNGAGKTTTIRMMLGQLSPHDGTVTIMGHDAWRDRAKVHQSIGYLSGDMALDMELTGKQYLHFLARLRGGVNSHRIHDLAQKLDCDLSLKIRKLSRGNRQKVALISALMHDPELLILDEPTSGFDPLIQAEFNKIILDYKKRGKTVFISSHILSEIQHLCDSVAFIREGKLVTVGKMQALTESTLKRVRVIFASEQDVSHIRAVRGVHQVTSDGRHAVFAFSGHMQDLLVKLADLAVVDLAIQDADLEELFMRYYKGGK
jgi:ABC-2 type transport system ATP-binding protein